MKNKIGRPSDFNAAIAERICLLMADGLSLRSICKRKDMPGQRTVFKWLIAHKEFGQQYVRARELQADMLFDECLEIADDTSGDYVEQEIGGKTVSRVNHENIQRSRLRVDTRKWIAGKLAPKKYGEKVTHEIRDPDGKPIAPIINLFGHPDLHEPGHRSKRT